MNSLGYNFNLFGKSKADIKLSRYETNELGEERTQSIIKKARKLGSQLNIHSIAVLPKKPPLNVDFASAIFNTEYDKRIHYNIFFLLKTEDIPENLRPTSENDPRLFMDDYLNEVMEEIRKKIGLEKFTLTKTDKFILRIIIRLLSDSEKCEQAKKFLLAHEISHLFYQHVNKLKIASQKLKIQKIVTSLAFGIFSGAIIKKLTTFTFLVALCGIITSGVTLFALNTLHTSSISRKFEKQADMKAAELVGPKGGIHFFDAIHKNILSLSKDSNLSLIQRMLITHLT